MQSMFYFNRAPGFIAKKNLLMFNGAPSVVDGGTGPGCLPAAIFSTQSKFYKSKQDIFHLRYVLPSTVVFTAD